MNMPFKNWNAVFDAAKSTKHKLALQAARKHLKIKLSDELLSSYIEYPSEIYNKLNRKNILWKWQEYAWVKFKLLSEETTGLTPLEVETLLSIGRMDDSVTSNVSLKSGTDTYRRARKLADAGLLNYVHNSYWSVTKAGWVMIHTINSLQNKNAN